MELIYAWVEDFRNIHQTGFSFSNRFKVTYSAEDRELKIEKNEEYFDYFKFANPDSRVTNISAVVGVNGSGKSNLLELISADKDHFKLRGEYFLIFHVADTDFYVEGLQSLDFPFFKNQRIYSEQNDSPKDALQLRIECRTENDDVVASYEHDDNQLYEDIIQKAAVLKYQKGSESGKGEEKRHGIRRYEAPNLNTIKDEFEFIQENKMLTNDTEKGLYIYSSHSNENKCDMTFHDHNLSIKEYYKAYSLNNFIVFLIDNIEIPEDKKESKFFWKKGLKDKYSIENHFNITECLNLVNKIISENPFGNLSTSIQDMLLFQSETINKIPSECFINHKHLRLDPIANKSLCKEFIDLYSRKSEKTNTTFNDLFHISFKGKSDGEQALIDLFSQISNVMQLAQTKYITSQKIKKIPESEQIFLENFILVLDEPDLYLHPDWNRQLVLELEKKITQIAISYTNKNVDHVMVAPFFQVIIASHSPFILSDLPSGNVIRLQKDEETGRCIVENNNSDEKYLAANIHDLFNNKFFMESTIGEYAKNTLQKVIEKLNNRDEELSEEDLAQMNQFADQLAEPLIRNKIKDMVFARSLNEKDEILREIERLKSKVRHMENRNDTTSKE